MFNRERSPGFWIFASVVDPLELEHIDRDKARAVDGYAGGTYAPTTAITIGQEGLTLAGINHHLSGVLTVDSLAQVTVANGGTIKAEGTGSADIFLRVVSGAARLEVESGAFVSVKSGAALDVFGSATVKSAASLTVDDGGFLVLSDGSVTTLADGAEMGVAGTITVVDGGAIVAQTGGSIQGNAGSAFAFGGSVYSVTVPSGSGQAFSPGSLLTGTGSALLTWSIVKVTTSFKLDGAGIWPTFDARTWDRDYTAVVGRPANASEPTAWEETSDLGTRPCVRTEPEETSGKFSLLRFDDLPLGGLIGSVVVKTRGTNVASSGATLPKYQIVSWTGDSTNYTVLSAEVDDAHDAATFPIVLVETTITGTASEAARTITAGVRYGLRVTHPYQSGFAQGVRIYKGNMAGTFTKLMN